MFPSCVLALSTEPSGSAPSEPEISTGGVAIWSIAATLVFTTEESNSTTRSARVRARRDWPAYLICGMVDRRVGLSRNRAKGKVVRSALPVGGNLNLGRPVVASGRERRCPDQ